jgi:molybdate transport system regulatory protein
MPRPMAARLSIRIDLPGGRRVGPGKIRLLELIDETGSISAAGRAMAMSYRRAWLLVESLNTGFREPVVDAQPGGRHGGGARLTPFGRDLVRRYRTLERDAARAVDRQVDAIADALAPGEPGR